MDDSYGTHGLTGQRWFAPVVAVWCALLLGGGFYLMPPGVHAALARGSGLSQVSPLFALPLGLSGLLILCGAFALLGLLAGWLAARRIAAAAAPRAFAPGFDVGEARMWEDTEEETAPPQGRRRRIFSASEELAEASLDTTSTAPEDAFEVEDVPETDDAGPEADFEAVYAEWNNAEPAADEPDAEPMADADADADAYYAPLVEETEYVEVDEAYVEVEEAIVEEAAEEPEPAAPVTDEQPLGDMSLDGLLGRLETALDTHREMVAKAEQAASEPAPQPVPMTPANTPLSSAEEHGLEEVSDDDPVIAFLRREANRRMPMPAANEDIETENSDHEPAAPSDDPQAALRSALDRLGQVGRSDT